MTHKLKTILLVDDEPSWLQTMQTVLTESHLSVMTADSGEDALTTLQTKKPDLILCDVRMPVMNGYDVFSKVKEISTLKSIPFVFMSHFDDYDAKKIAKQMGADDYVAKPFTMDEVHIVVKDLLKRFEQ
jgi:DNA-binding response OmpR family regulator